MGFEIPFIQWTREAAADLSAGQFRGLVMSGSQVAIAGAGARIVGVLQNKPAAAGRAATIYSGGLTKAEMGATVAANADVAIDATGRFVTAAGSAAICGIAIEGGDVGDIGTVLLFASTAADPRSHFLTVQDVDVSGGASFFAVAPVAGNIARVRTVVTTVLAGAAEPGAVALELATVLVVGSGVTIAAEAAVGDTDDSGAITPGGTTAVAAGDAIEITTDSVPTSGVVTVVIEIVPS